MFTAKNYNYYRETKKYKKVTTWDSGSKQKYLVVNMTNVTDGLPSTHTELRQYLHYDVIQEGIEVGVEQLDSMDLTNCNVYLIIEGSTDTPVDTDLLTRIEQVWNKKITDENGQSYSLTDFYTEPHIVENLYIREDHKPVSVDGENYDIGQHLYDNDRVLYNDLDERMYTINQIVNDLLYKNPGTYTFTVFDLKVPQHIGLYRRKANAAVREIVDFELRINASTPSYDATDTNLDLHYKIAWTPHNYTDDGINDQNITQGEFWTNCTQMTYNNTLPLIYQEQCALIEANLQQYWNEAYSASLLCDIFVPSDWRLKSDKVPNHYEIITRCHINKEKATAIYADTISSAIASTMASHKISTQTALNVTMTVNNGVINIYKASYNSGGNNVTMYCTDEFTLQPGYYYMRDPLCPAGVTPGPQMADTDPRGARFGVAHLIGTTNYDTDGWDGHSSLTSGWLTSEWRGIQLATTPIKLMFILKSNKQKVTLL